MDELRMDSLELPEMGHDYNELPDAYGSFEDNGRGIESEKAYEDELSDIEMPVLSEMDGSAVQKPSEVQPAPKQTAAASVSDMGASALGNPKPAAVGYTPVSSASGIASSRGAASYGEIYSSNGTGTFQSNMTSNADSFFAGNDMVWSEDYEKGKKRAKIVGIFAIVLDVLETLTMLSLRNILVTVVRIALICGFMKGSNSARKITGYFSILRLIINIASVAQVDSWTQEFAAEGLSFIITIVQLILFLGIFANCAVIYFAMFDRCIKEYTVDR